MSNARDTRPPKPIGAGSRGGKSSGSAPSRKFLSQRRGCAAEEDLSVDFSQSVTTNMDELSLGCSPDKIEKHPLYAVIEEYMIRDPRVRALIERIEGEEDDDEESATIEGTATYESSLFGDSSTSYYDGDSSAGSSILESIFASSSPVKKLGTPRAESGNLVADTPSTIYTSSPRGKASSLAATPSANPVNDREAAKCGSRKKRWPSIFAKSRSKEKKSKKLHGEGEGDGVLANELDSLLGSLLQTPQSPKDDTLKTVTSQESVKDFMRSLILEEETEIAFEKSDENKSPDKLWGNLKLWEKCRAPPSEEIKKPEASAPKKDSLEMTKSESTAAVNNTSLALTTEAPSINVPKGGISSVQSELSSTTSVKYSRLRDKHQSVLEILTVPSESVELPTPADPEQAVQRLQSLKERHHSIREILSLPSEDSIPVELESAEKEYEKLKAKLKSIRSILVSPQQTGAATTGYEATTESSASKMSNPFGTSTGGKVIKCEKSPSKGFRARLSKRKADEKSSVTKLAQSDSTSETQGSSTRAKNSISCQAGKLDLGGDAEKQQQTLEVAAAAALSDKSTNVKPPLKTKKMKMKLAIAHQGRRSVDSKLVHPDQSPNIICEENVETSGIEVAVGNDQSKNVVIGVPTKSANTSVERKKCIASDKLEKRDVFDEQAKKVTSDEPRNKGTGEVQTKGATNQPRNKVGGEERKKDASGELKTKVVAEKKGASNERKKQKKVNSFKGGKQQDESKPWYKKNLTSKVRVILPTHSKPDLELEIGSSQQSRDSTYQKEDRNTGVGDAENVSMARNVATSDTSRCGPTATSSSSSNSKSKKKADQRTNVTASSAHSLAKDKTNVKVEKNLKTPIEWKESKSEAPTESKASRTSTVTKTDSSCATQEETLKKSNSCNRKMEKRKSTPAVLKDQSTKFENTELASKNAAVETTVGAGVSINEITKTFKSSTDSAKVHAEHHSKTKTNQSQRATSSDTEKKVHFELSGDHHHPVGNPLDPVTDASFVEKAVREMNVVEAQTEPQAQVRVSEKTPLSIYRFLDFNPCHSELPLSPRSRQSKEGVKITGLCTADSTTDRELPKLVSNRGQEVPATVGSSSTTRPLTPGVTSGRRFLEKTESSDSGITSLQDDATPRAANRIGISNPCGGDSCDFESVCEADDNNRPSCETQFMRDTFQCTEDSESRTDVGGSDISQNCIRDALFCNTHAPQVVEPAPKSNCSRGSKNSVTFKDGLIDDGPKRSRSLCFIPNSKAPKAQPSALRRRENRAKQEDVVYDESIEMFNNYVNGEYAGDTPVEDNIKDSQVSNTADQVNTKDNQVSLINKMKQSLRKSPKKVSVPAERTRVRDGSVCKGNRDVPESQSFVRASSAPSVRTGSTATSVERLAVIRDEYTRARSSPAHGGSVGDSSSKISEIREEYKKARKVIARKGDPTPTKQAHPAPTVQTPHGSVSALSPSVNSRDGELTEAEKAVARRLAKDLMILSKIARRRAMGKRASDRKVNDIERSMELVHAINRARRRKRTASDEDSISSSFTGSGTIDTSGTGNTAGTGTPTTPFTMGGMFGWLLVPENAGK